MTKFIETLFTHNKILKGQNLNSIEICTLQNLYGNKIYTQQNLYGNKIYTKIYMSQNL